MTKRVVGMIAAVLVVSCGRGSLDQSSAIVPITPFADTCPQMGTPGTLTKLKAFDAPKLFGAFGPCRLLLSGDANPPSTLWLSDGTPNGTQSIADAFRWGMDYRMLGRTAVFSSFWRTDGTGAGSFALAAGLQNGSGASLADTAMLGDAMLFAATADRSDAPVEAQHGYELWRTDGTLAGTSMAAELIAGPDPAYESPNGFIVVDGAVMFSGGGHDLWRSDGTAAGTRRVAPIRMRTGAPLGGALLFVGGPHDATGKFTSVGLWRTDGTEAGTTLLLDLSTPNAEHASFYVGTDTFALVPLGDRMIVLASPGPPDITVENGTTFPPGPPIDAIWSTDGTAAGTHFGTELPEWERASTPFNAFVLNGAVLFKSSSQRQDPEYSTLWRTDGTAAGTFALAPLFGFLDVDAANRNVFFAAATAETGRELWISDGTAANTRLVKDINPGPAGSLYTAYSDRLSAAVGRGIIVAADDGTHGPEPWFSDGTAAGTKLIADIFPGTQGSALGPPTTMNGAVFFAATASAPRGFALWRFDPP